MGEGLSANVNSTWSIGKHVYLTATCSFTKRGASPSFLTRQQSRVSLFAPPRKREKKWQCEEEESNRSSGDTAISLVWCNAHRKGRGVTELGKPTLVLCLCRCLPLRPTSVYRFSTSPLQPRFPTLTQSPYFPSLLFQRDLFSLIRFFPSFSSSSIALFFISLDLVLRHAKPSSLLHIAATKFRFFFSS